MGREALGVLEGRERYELVRLIAEGGMGTVYKARKIGVAGSRSRCFASSSPTTNPTWRALSARRNSSQT